MARILTVFVMSPAEALAYGHELLRHYAGSEELLFQTEPDEYNPIGYHWVRAVAGDLAGMRLDWADSPEELLERHPESEAEWQHDASCPCARDPRVKASGAQTVIVLAQADRCGLPYEGVVTPEEGWSEPQPQAQPEEQSA